MRSVHLVNISQKKVCLQLTPKNVETQCWIAKTLWQRIPGRRACNSKTPTTKTVQTIARNDQLPLTGRPQMLTTNNFGRWCAAVHRVQRSHSIKTSIHQHGELKLYSVGERRPERLKFKLIASLFKITAVINFPVRCINIICCVVVQRGGFLTTGNPCPVCRDEYLVLHPEVSSVLLLFQFNTESCC